MIARKTHLGLSRLGRFFAAALLLAVTLPLTAPRTVAQAPGKLPVIEEKTIKNFTQKLNDRVSFDMIAIPGGTFLMGSPEKETDRDKNEGPQHPVRLKPFWMGKCEVTWDEYDLYWEVLPGKKADPIADAVSRPTNPYGDQTFGHGRDGQPAVCMTHHAAAKYCRFLSLKTGKLYRLPTEAEWEWACRAGTTTAYHFGETDKDLGDYAWFGDNANEHTHVVAKKKPNPWGLFDMHGNVAEWCIDSYEAGAYAKRPLDRVTLQPVLLDREKRYPFVVRGGSWSQNPDKCRSATRLFSDVEWLRRDPNTPKSIWWMTDADFVGFRVVCPVDEQEEIRGYDSLTTKKTPE